MSDRKILDQKLMQAELVLEETLDQFASREIVIAWSGGKDSTLMLDLFRTVCGRRNLAVPRVLDIDQGDAFPEIIAFRDRLVREWSLDLVLVRNNDLLDRVRAVGDSVTASSLSERNRAALKQTGFSDTAFPWIPGSAVCNHLAKAIPVLDYLYANGVKAMCTGIRWDEHSARRNETYFSPRTDPDHLRVHPLLHFTERDIWDATFARGLPFNDLYRLGYRSIDSRSGTRKTADVPAWEQDLEHTTERGGRDGEKERIMEQLRALGYM